MPRRRYAVVFTIVLIATLAAAVPALAVSRWPVPRHDGGATNYNGGELRMTPDRVLIAQERRVFTHRTFVVPPLVADGSLFVAAARPDSYPRIIRSTLRGEPIWTSELLCDAAPVSVGRIVQYFSYDCADGLAPVVTVDGDDFSEELWRSYIVFPRTAAGVTYGYTYHFDSESDRVLDDLVALEALTGVELWRRPRPEDGYGWRGRPLVADERLYVHRSGSIAAFDASTGEALWTVEPRPDQVITPVAVRDGVLYCVMHTSNFEAVRIRAVGPDGGQLWSTRLPSSYGDNLVNGGMAVGGGTLVATGTRSVTALESATGDTRWSYRINAFFPRTGAVVGAAGVFYLTDALNRRIVAVRATDGSVIREFPGALSAIVAAGRIYATDDGGLSIYG